VLLEDVYGYSWMFTGKRQSLAAFEGNEGDFVGEVALLQGMSFFGFYTAVA
jgi:hypothetical protein